MLRLSYSGHPQTHPTSSALLNGPHIPWYYEVRFVPVLFWDAEIPRLVVYQHEDASAYHRAGTSADDRLIALYRAEMDARVLRAHRLWLHRARGLGAFRHQVGYGCFDGLNEGAAALLEMWRKGCLAETPKLELAGLCSLAGTERELCKSSRR